MTVDLRYRVRAGAAYLDAKIPDWLNRINTDRLKMWSPCKCIIGQLTGDYWRNFERIAPHHLTRDEAEEWAENHGFILPGRNHDELTEAWIAEILSRRELLIPA